MSDAAAAVVMVVVVLLLLLRWWCYFCWDGGGAAAAAPAVVLMVVVLLPPPPRPPSLPRKGEHGAMVQLASCKQYGHVRQAAHPRDHLASGKQEYIRDEKWLFPQKTPSLRAAARGRVEVWGPWWQKPGLCPRSVLLSATLGRHLFCSAMDNCRLIKEKERS